MFAKLWNDESGIVALEYLLLATIVGLGLVVGMGNLEGALNAEFTELGNAILALDQGYAVAAQSGCKAAKSGSNTGPDTNGTLRFNSAAVAPGAGIDSTGFCINVTAP